MPRYALPDLPYDYAALEPHLAGEIMELHHDKHHRAYVQGANRAIEQLLEARHRLDFSALGAIERALAFNISAHVLHSMLWQNLTPAGGDRPQGELAAAIDRDFGSFDAFRSQLNAAAMNTMGSGWALLTYDPILRRLGTTLVHDHQSEVTQGSVPLLALDAWEHAYYLQYRTEKARYFESIWNLWNWEDVAVRFARAQALDLSLVDVAEATPAPPPGAELHH